MKSRTTFIYTLSTKEEPGNIRYIGKANDPKDREKRHLQPYYLNENTYKTNWLKSELKKGNSPILTIVDEVLNSEWQYWETYWIEQFIAWGFKLTNGTAGGEGLVLTKKLINKRSQTRMNNTALKIKNEIEFCKIKKENNLWNGERECNHCNDIVKYQKTIRADLMKTIRRAINENRMCENCWSDNVIFCGGNGFEAGESNPNFNGNKGVDNPFYRKSHTKETIQLIKEKSNSKKIIQMDLLNNTLNEFNSIREAERETGTHRAHISKCCNNKPNHKTAGGFKWSFK
jgi:group I intron endonuclease